MNSIGETLRRERLRLNLDLEQVARETKINLKLLQAIENEDFSKLPGGVFTKSFVRQYARLLGLDEDEIAAELERGMEPADASRELTPPPAFEPAIGVSRVPDWPGTGASRGSSLPALAGVVAVMLLCSGIYALWQRSNRPVTVAEVPAVASRVAEPAPPAAAAALAPAEPAPAPQPTAPQPVAEVTPASTAERLGDPVSNVRVGLTASEPTWISVRSDGKFVFAGTLQPNETRELDGADLVRIVLGNAGGVAVTLNGKPLPPMGPSGQVRVVQFSPGGVQIVPRTPPPSDAL